MANRVLSPIKLEERQKLDLRSGDTVRVFQKIQEKGKTRLQAFEGLVLARKHGKEAGATFTVRRIARQMRNVRLAKEVEPEEPEIVEEVPKEV